LVFNASDDKNNALIARSTATNSAHAQAPMAFIQGKYFSLPVSGPVESRLPRKTALTMAKRVAPA